LRLVLVTEGSSVVAFIERQNPPGENYGKPGKSRSLSLATFHPHDEISGYLILAGFSRPVTHALIREF
jgi:hypothetical protein